MVSTRSMSKMLSEEIKDELKKLMEPLVESNESLENPLKKFKNEIINSFDLKLKEKQVKIDLLESKVAAQETLINYLEIQVNSNQQYSRRYSLRIHGVEYKNNESRNNLVELGKNCY